MQLREYITKVLLENAIKYDGTTKANAAMGAVMREFPEYRGDAGTVMPVAQEVAQEINALSVEEQQQRLDAMGGSDAPEKEERDPFELEHENPVLRFEPSPSGPMHIGHAFPLGLNHLLAVRNEGKLILRIADTNPDNIYPQAYDLLEDDAQWYTHQGISEVIIQSDRLPLYYSYAEKMLANGWAYICSCTAEEFREHSQQKTECPCREQAPAKHLERWELMQTSWEPGDAVMRIKTDMTHKNPAIRDWPAMRINLSEHPRQGTKHRVWPLMNFSVSVDDIELGMTHVLRAKDHADNARRQEWMYEYFDEKKPETYFVGKINFTDLKLSTSSTRKKIDEGEYTGWDDIRLPFLPALRRRGYQAESLLRLADEVGISSTDKTISKEEYFSSIDSFNRELIDAEADRAFFVEEPIKIVINDAPTINVQKPRHPDHPERGTRKLTVGQEVYVQAEDIKDPKGVLFRLVDAYNFRFDNGKWVYVSESYDDFKDAQNKRIIHYLPAEHNTGKARIRYPDGSEKEGLAEQHVRTYDNGSILQFERVGFVRLDDVAAQEFWYAHD